MPTRPPPIPSPLSRRARRARGLGRGPRGGLRGHRRQRTGPLGDDDSAAPSTPRRSMRRAGAVGRAGARARREARQARRARASEVRSRSPCPRRSRRCLGSLAADGRARHRCRAAPRRGAARSSTPTDPTPDELALAQPAAPIAARSSRRNSPWTRCPRTSRSNTSLTSAFADGRATLHLEARRRQLHDRRRGRGRGLLHAIPRGAPAARRARGTVTARGPAARPLHRAQARQSDRRGPPVRLGRGQGRRSTGRQASQDRVDIAGNTVDWLSMIFQLAHVPPSGDSYDLRVYTQRRFYEFHLMVLGAEEIEIPLGKVRALHLRHVDPQDGSVDRRLARRRPALPAGEAALSRRAQPAHGRASRHEHVRNRRAMNLTRAQLDAIVHALTVVLPARAPADTQLRTFFREQQEPRPARPGARRRHGLRGAAPPPHARARDAERRRRARSRSPRS